MTKRNLFNISLAAALISAMLFSMLGFTSSCEEMYDNIIRIRIIANSDSKEDQQLKLRIRDAVLKESQTVYNGEDISYEDALILTEENLSTLTAAAQNTVKKYGYDYTVRTQIRDEFFDTRTYDDFTLPAGTYKTAVFEIGEAQGQNWWCVIFPRVCVGTCKGEITDTVSQQSANYTENYGKFKVKFKTVEIFGKIKNFLF